MGKKNIAALVILFLTLCSSLFILACGSSEVIEDVDMHSILDNQIINSVLDNYEDGDIITGEDIAIDQIFYGTFSQDGANEILVTCKILNQPHVAGLDKTVGVLMNSDTMEVIAYKEFPFDRVDINCMKTSSGYKRILVLGTSTSQGISMQEVYFFAIRENQWVDTPVEVLETFSVEQFFCFATEDGMIVSHEDQLKNPKEIIAILRWNPDEEKFVING